MIDYKRKIKTLRGEEMPKNFPNQKEIDALPHIKNRQGIEVPNLDKLERETVGNVIINCLAFYSCQDKKEGFYVNMIAESIISNKGEKVELKDKLKTFLLEVLDKSILREKKEKDKTGNETTREVGVYSGWVIAQVLEELGVKEEI